MSFEYSTFPKSLDYPNDSTAYLSDLTADDWKKIKDYNQALIDGRVSDAAAILEELEGKHIAAKDINKIIDCIRAIETAYFNNAVKNNEIISNGDFNDMKTPGIYTMRASSANSPVNDKKYYGLIVLKSDTASFVEQIAFGESRYDVYIRYLNNFGWSEWRKINDGGNAATLDGYHASDFAEAEHGHDNYLPLGGGTISNSEEHINITPWGIQGNNNSEIYDFYSVAAQKINAGEIEENGEALTNKYSNKEHTHTIDQITDFTPDSIINSSDFTKYEIFTTLEELSETMYEGLFYISGSQITGISLKSGQETDIQPDKTVYWDVYTRIYFDNSGNMYAAVDTHNDETDFWSRKFLKTFSSNLPDSHTHTKSQITDFPASLPANGGNADTVDGKHAADFAETNHTHKKSDIIDFPASLPADGGNADTISGIGIDSIQTKQTGTSSYTDWNDIVEPGFHKLMERGTENEPNGGDWFFPIVFAYSSSGITQLAVAYRYDWIYMRHKKKLDSGITGWTEWRKINDGGNADTIAGKGINAIQTRDSGYCFYNQNKDWNDLTDTGYYGLMHSTSTALHNPVNGKFFYPMVFKYANDSVTQIAVPHLAGHDDGSGMVYIRSKNSSYNGWSEWTGIGDGCNAASVNKKTVSFTASAGNWYRLVKGKPHNNSDNTGACGIMTIMADASNQHSCDVITVAENKGAGSFTLHNHGNFNEFFGKYRMVKGLDGYMYIDAFINSYNSNINNLSATFTFTFSGVGWEPCGSVNTANSNYGTVVDEKEL